MSGSLTIPTDAQVRLSRQFHILLLQTLIRYPLEKIYMHSTLRNFSLLAFLFLLILAFAPSGKDDPEAPAIMTPQ